MKQDVRGVPVRVTRQASAAPSKSGNGRTRRPSRLLSEGVAS